jgi:hypothetical protein
MAPIAEASGTVVTLDPAFGKTSAAGVAVWREGLLRKCDRVRPAPNLRLDGRGDQCQAFVTAILGKLASWGALAPDAIVYEWPQVYRAARAPGDPNDLLGLVAVGAGVAACLEALAAERNSRDGSLTIYTPLPSEWAGQLPKTKSGDPWESLRGQRVSSRLSSQERALVPKSHDALDAVGIGLWALGRFERRLVLDGASLG